FAPFLSLPLQLPSQFTQLGVHQLAIIAPQHHREVAGTALGFAGRTGVEGGHGEPPVVIDAAATRQRADSRWRLQPELMCSSRRILGSSHQPTGAARLKKRPAGAGVTSIQRGNERTATNLNLGLRYYCKGQAFRAVRVCLAGSAAGPRLIVALDAGAA